MHFNASLKIQFVIFLFGVSANLFSQNLTFSPYSRYGLGELNATAFSQIQGLGGTFIGFKPDTTSPIFINAGNPAAISGIRLTTLELGGIAQFSQFDNGITKVKTKTVNFSYACLGFPIKQRAAACFGIMPYSNVGYNLKTDIYQDGIGTVTTKYTGSGGINKAFFGVGTNPFKKVITRFYRSAYRDTLISHHKVGKYKRIKFRKQLLSELSIGGRADYLFGNILDATNVVYPGSINFYNTRRFRGVNYNSITAGFGIQTSFNIDSVGKRELRKKIKIGFGYYMSLPNTIRVKNNYMAYNYTLNGFGDEIPKDTFIYHIDQPSSIRLPLEQGIGISLKKGDMLTVAADASYTNWQQFRYLDKVNDLKNSYRLSLGINFVPNKYAAGSGAYAKRIQYRLGAFYNTGYLELKNTAINNYAITVGFGLPVGLFRQFSVVNLSAQFGKMGSINNNLIDEKYIKLVIGFTFNDKWFTKFRYD